jgi:orotidine-5'-phosphate decarboxylase
MGKGFIMKPLIVALDVDTEKEAMRLVKATRKFVDVYKVGPGLVMKYGPSILKKVKSGGKKVFLDLKFHDIPNTVARTVAEAGRWGLFSATVHISAGENALHAAVAVKKRPLLWGVTVLTSLSEQDMLRMGWNTSPLDQVLRLADIAKRVNLDGVVASVGETIQLRRLLGNKIKIITPGIRMPEESMGDQVRTASPQHARESGSDFIVVGRPIIEARNPALAAQMIVKDWNKAGKKKG